TYDATANLNYIFDQENRINGAGGYAYTYDADGERVKKSNGTTGTLYWYMTPGIVAESDLAGTLTSEYVFFDGERVARKDFPGNTVTYYFSDHLKTASVITDSSKPTLTIIPGVASCSLLTTILITTNSLRRNEMVKPALTTSGRAITRTGWEDSSCPIAHLRISIQKILYPGTCIFTPKITRLNLLMIMGIQPDQLNRSS